jgi:hypothetical protein
VGVAAINSRFALYKRVSSFSSLLADCDMVRTRAGHDVFHTEASYGRAARVESSRKHRKRRLLCAVSMQDGDGGGESGTTSTPRRATRKTRGQIRQEEDVATPPSALSRVGVTPPSKNERMLRGRVPTCSDYGISRHFAFRGNGYFFCHACDFWDSLPPDRSKKCSRTSKRLACTAGHTSFSHPTTYRNDYCKRGAATTLHFDSDDSNSTSEPSTSSSIMMDTIATDEDDDTDYGPVDNAPEDVGTNLDICDGAADEVAAAPHTNNQPGAAEDVLRGLLRSRDQEVNRLEGKVALLQVQIRNMSRKIKKWQAADVNEALLDPNVSRNDVFKQKVVESINKVLIRYPRWSSNRTGALVVQALWSQEVNLPELLKLSRKYFRENVFTPYNVLREMDLAGGTLSYAGIDVLRRVETGGVKRFRGSMIPSKSEIKRMASLVEWFARPRCPFAVKQTSKGEAVEFDYAKSMLCITQAFHLDDVGKRRSLSVASSIDGASLTKNISMIAGGIKIIDRGARCPLTRKPLLDNPTTMTAQSRNLCIPLKIMMGRETTETFTEFATLFQFLDSLSAAENLPPELAGFMPFQCMTNCDLSAQWKGLCKGGAAKVHTLPCTGCATESDSLATPNPHLCTRWCYEHSLVDPEWMCFHKAMATPERVSTIKTEVAELLLVLGSALEEIKAESQMACHDVETDSPLVGSTTDPTSIHYIPTNAHERHSFSRLLSNELMLRNLDNGGSIEIRRDSLRESLQREAIIVRLSKEIAHGEVKEGAYFLLMNTLPCVLHMENRNGIKLLTMVFIEGLSNAKKKLLYVNVSAEGTRVSRFVADIERIVNTTILGSKDDPCQWTCPFDIKKKELGPITMDNVRTRRVVNELHTLVAFCVTDQDRASLWLTALNNYRRSMELLRKRDDFTNVDIADYQSHADKFFQAWVRLWQKEGITNYIHMIGSGHIADYLYKWKNLYRYSQQGWEAMNSLVKTFFFRRTSHGGGVKGDDSKKSRLIPIARWLQRRLIFLCRTTEGSIRQHAEEHPMPTIFRTQGTSSENDVYE